VKSEVLVTGVADTRGAVVLVVPDPAVAHDTIDNGAKLY
jgi:hypothetical protein